MASDSLVQKLTELFSWSFASSLGVYVMDLQYIFFAPSPITAVDSVLIMGLVGSFPPVLILPLCSQCYSQCRCPSLQMRTPIF